MSKVKGKVLGIGAGKVVVFAACGLLALLIILGLGGFASPFPDTEITHRKPYADFVGHEYRVTSAVSAYSWNAFPDKARIVSISLVPPPGVNNGSDGVPDARVYEPIPPIP